MADGSDPLSEVLDRLTLLEHGRQALVDSLWSRIPSYVVESGYGAAVTEIALNAQTTQLERITCIIATLPKGATGLLQLADVVIPLGEGVNTLGGVSFLLTTTATRHLSSDTTGPMALVLMGEVAPQWGVMS